MGEKPGRTADPQRALSSSLPRYDGAAIGAKGQNTMRRMLVGLIGANIQKSLSPALHEDALAAAGIHGHYHLMDLDRLPGRGLADLLSAARTAGFAGVNITYPCKQSVMSLLDAVSSEAHQTGAVNTVTIAGDGSTMGYNTDRVGFRRAFEETLGSDAASGMTVLLVGAGGAGRAVAYALLDMGVQTLLINDKDLERASRLTAALISHFGPGRARIESEPKAALSKSSGVVNATPVGMLGIPGNPIPVDAIAPYHWVADVIYTPLETELIKIARAKGAKVMGGAGMCVHQAAETFRLFTGRSPDVHRMHRVFAEAAAIRDRSLAEA